MPNKVWHGIMTLPRRITMRRSADDRIRLVQVLVGLETLRGVRIPSFSGYIEPLTQKTIMILVNTATEFLVTVVMDKRQTSLPDGEQGRSGRFMLALENGQGEELVVGFDAFRSQLWIDRSRLSGFKNPFFTGQFSTSLPSGQLEFSQHCIFDGSTFEVYVNNGTEVGTLLVYPQALLDRLTLTTTNTGANIKELAIWPLKKTMPRETAEKFL